jgi:hypothetical protein
MDVRLFPLTNHPSVRLFPIIIAMRYPANDASARLGDRSCLEADGSLVFRLSARPVAVRARRVVL